MTREEKLAEFVAWTDKNITGDEKSEVQGREVRRVRAETLKNIKGGLRALYRTLELPGANPLKDAHAAHAAAVLAAYGFNANKDLLAQLLALNLEIAKRIEAGQPVSAPGIPASYPDVTELVTPDCIAPKEAINR